MPAQAEATGWLAQSFASTCFRFEKQSRLQQEKASLLRAQAGEELARNMIRVEVSRAYFGHQSAAKMVEVARNSMAQAAESLRILRNRYDAGLVPLTDVLRAEDADRQSQSGYWQASIATH